MSDFSANKALEWTNIALGAALVLVPFTAGFDPISAAAWNAYLIGGLVALCATAALLRFKLWLEWTNMTAGCWIVISPVIFAISSNPTALWLHLIIGVCIACLAGVQAFKSRQGTIT
jgi:hypothetical protein